MIVRVAEPLPECALCENPVLRETFEANGGLCNGCTRGISDTIRMLPPGRVVDLDHARRQRLLHEHPPTVFVEHYTPDLPPPAEPIVEWGVLYTDDEP